MWEHMTPQAVSTTVVVLAAILGGNAWITSALISIKLRDLTKEFVPLGECILRSSGNRQLIESTQTEGRAACLAAVNRDAATQDRIDDLVRIITSRAAEAILRDQEILGKINELLRRER